MSFALENQVKELQERLTECRKHLAESVCKECKCPQNIEVNMKAIEDNLRLKADLENERRIAQKRITNLEAQLEAPTKCLCHSRLGIKPVKH